MADDDNYMTYDKLRDFFFGDNLSNFYSKELYMSCSNGYEGPVSINASKIPSDLVNTIAASILPSDVVNTIDASILPPEEGIIFTIYTGDTYTHDCDFCFNFMAKKVYTNCNGNEVNSWNGCYLFYRDAKYPGTYREQETVDPAWGAFNAMAFGEYDQYLFDIQTGFKFVMSVFPNNYILLQAYHGVYPEDYGQGTEAVPFNLPQGPWDEDSPFASWTIS